MAISICTAGASEDTRSLRADLDRALEKLVEAAAEHTLVEVIVNLVTSMGDEESAAFIMRRALAAASRSPGYDR